MADINAESFAAEARGESAADRANSYSGESAGRGLLNNSGSAEDFTRDLGGSVDPAMSAAIRQKYSGDFSHAQNRLNLENVKSATGDHLKKLEVATQMADQELNMNVQKEMLRKKQAQAKAMMRGQLVGAVLGITGGVVGGVATGSPMGAMAGYQLGSGAGQAIGGTE